MSAPASLPRPELTPMPPRIQTLPVHRGYPVPWFVAIVNGEPEFRTADSRKWRRAINEKLCWVCGQKLGSYLTFVLGPMCGITRTTSEPPVHMDCGHWSVLNCPFMVRPHAVRRTEGLPEGAVDAPGCPLDRNPGVTLLWTTRSYKLFKVEDNRYLITVGDPEQITCWAEGREATDEEMRVSVDGGFPRLMEIAKAEGPRAVEELLRRKSEFLTLVGAQMRAL